MAPKDIADLNFGTAAPRARFFSLPNNGRAVALLMVAFDILALVLAFIIGATISDPLREILTGETANYGVFGPRTNILPALLGLMVAVFAFGGLYKRDGWEAEEIKRLIAGIALIALFDAALAFITKDHFSRLWFVIAWPLAMVFVVSFRMSLRSLPWARDAMTSHIVLIGGGKRPDDFLYELRESRSGPINLVATLPLGAMPTLTLNDMSDWLAEQAAREGIGPAKLQVVLVPAPEEAQAARILTERLSSMRQPFLVTVSYDGLARQGLTLHKIIGSDMVLAGVTPPWNKWSARAMKRGMDLILTGLGMVIIAPVMLVIAVLIKLEDGGPIFFSQPRVGKDSKRFGCLKFRSMHVDAQARLAELLEESPAARAEWETHQKLANDPRITRVGRFLRDLSLDELPQLINVLKGDMSLVGPRPIIGPEIPGYESDAAYYEGTEIRHYLRCVPGITGLWQVSGRHRTSHTERVRLDRWYARNSSIWLDLAILFKTFRVVIARSGG